MAWIESHQELGAHPKTQKLARLLGVSRPAAVGHLQFLWWWATDYAPDGDLTRFEPLDIAIGGEWDGDPDAFLSALERSAFLDRSDSALTIHDWDQYAGRLIEKRRQDAERKRQSRSVQGSSAGQVTDVQETAHVTVPNLTIPNTTEEENGVPSEPALDAPPPQESATVDPQSADAGRSAGDVYGLVDAFADGKGLARGDLVGRARKTAYSALAHAPPWVTTGDVVGCTTYMLTDPFWDEPGKLKPHHIVEALPEWRNKGRPAAIKPRGRNGPGDSGGELDPSNYKDGAHLSLRGR